MINDSGFEQVGLDGAFIQKDQLLVDRFIEPPFSVLDTKSGRWQNRRRKWLELGIKSELGRFDNLTFGMQCMDYEEEKMRVEQEKQAKKGIGLPEFDEKYGRKAQGTSIFDPVLCEIMYKWYCEEGDRVLDPFAGGSVRGIVASYLGYKYTGIELRPEQVESNKQQGVDILQDKEPPYWLCGDSNKVLDTDMFDEKYDFVFSCPPYMDLEVYSDMPEDLSNKSDDEFYQLYNSIIKKSCHLLKRRGFAAWVVGDVRDEDGFYKDFLGGTKAAFKAAGMKLYNEIILLNSMGSAPVRANNAMRSKKVVKVHQNIYIFYKP